MDIYGAGGLLYYLVTGRKPGYFYMLAPTEFDREIAGLDRGVAAVVRKAMANLPEDRYRTAFETASACATAADGLPGRAAHAPVASAWVRDFESTGTPPGWWRRVTGWLRPG